MSAGVIVGHMTASPQRLAALAIAAPPRLGSSCAAGISLADGAAGTAILAVPASSAGGRRAAGARPASAAPAARRCSESVRVGQVATGAVAVSSLPDPRYPRDFPAPPLCGSCSEEIAGRSAGGAAPAPADQGGLSSGRAAVNPLAALGVAGAPRLFAEVTAPRPRAAVVGGGGHAPLDAAAGPVSTDSDLPLTTTDLRPSPLAIAGTSRGVPASPSYPTRPTPEAGRQEEN